MENITFEIFTRGTIEWTTEGSSIISTENLERIRHTLENVGSIIVEHWHFYGSRAPDKEVFDDFEDFIEYLEKNAVAGDVIDVWSMHDLCKPENRIAEGKCPDKDGKLPKGGAY